MLKSQGEKSSEIQGGSQEMVVMVGQWQNLIMARHCYFTRNQHQNDLNCLY